MVIGEKDKINILVKLGTGGDYYNWISRLKTHFEVKDLWGFVESGEELEDRENETAAVLAAKAKRDLIAALHAELVGQVIHLETAHDIFVELKRLFVGSETAERRKLGARLQGLKFEGYFGYLNEFKVLVQRLSSLGGVNSHKDVAYMFLDGIPKEHINLIYGCRNSIDQAEEDNQEVFDQVFNKVLEYLIEAGLYDVSKRQFMNKTFHVSSFSAIPAFRAFL